MGETAKATDGKRINLNSMRLREYPHFVGIVEKMILDQIGPDIRQKITAVIGLTNVGTDMVLAFRIASALNEERRAVCQTEDFLHCRAVYYKMIDSLFVKYLQTEDDIKPTEKDDFVLFVHCCFDKMSSSELARLAKIDEEFQEEKKREFLFSEYLERENYRRQLFKVSRLGVDHSIIIPVPRDAYINFMLHK